MRRVGWMAQGQGMWLAVATAAVVLLTAGCGEGPAVGLKAEEQRVSAAPNPAGAPPGGGDTTDFREKLAQNLARQSPGFNAATDQAAAGVGLAAEGRAPASAPQPARILPTPAAKNPNFYVANTYQPGNGEKDRLEKLIREGVLVDGKRVKLEAFTRAYRQTFPIPTSTALSVFADTERAAVVRQGARTFLQVGLQAARGEAPRRPRLNVAVALDTSGSMASEQKLEFARSAAAQLVDRMQPSDRLALVCFDSAARLVAPSAPVRERHELKRRIGELTPGSGTNIYAGLELAYREVSKAADRDAVNLVLLLSDGEVTQGITDPGEFQQLARKHAEAGIQTSSVGMGVEFNEELMLSLAQTGQGNYHFIRDGADTTTVFNEELDELSHVVARAVRLRIVLAPGVGLVRVLGAPRLDAGAERQVRTDERKIDEQVYRDLGIRRDRQRLPEEPGIKILIPNFRRGDSHVVMLEIEVPPGSDRRKVASVFLKYKDLILRRNQDTTATCGVEYVPDQAQMLASTNPAVKKNLLGFQTGEALTEAARLIDEGRTADAVRAIDERMVVLGIAAREWSDRDLDRDGRLLEQYKQVLVRLAANPGGGGGELGDYLKKSLTYNGSQMLR